jgi:hypothetical protein
MVSKGQGPDSSIAMCEEHIADPVAAGSDGSEVQPPTRKIEC